jgi:hypothetical protein
MYLSKEETDNREKDKIFRKKDAVVRRDKNVLAEDEKKCANGRTFRRKASKICSNGSHLSETPALSCADQSLWCADMS